MPVTGAAVSADHRICRGEYYKLLAVRFARIRGVTPRIPHAIGALHRSRREAVLELQSAPYAHGIGEAERHRRTELTAEDLVPFVGALRPSRRPRARRRPLPGTAGSAAPPTPRTRIHAAAEDPLRLALLEVRLEPGRHALAVQLDEARRPGCSAWLRSRRSESGRCGVPTLMYQRDGSKCSSAQPLPLSASLGRRSPQDWRAVSAARPACPPSSCPRASSRAWRPRSASSGHPAE